MDNQQEHTFEDVNDRLKEIRFRVEDSDTPLDDALDLFEEAVQLGMQASSLLEDGIAQQDDPDQGSAGEAGAEPPAVGNTF